MISFDIDGVEGRKIYCDLRAPAGNSPKPVFIFMHGFKGWKSWGFIPYLCENLAEAGTIAISFDFSMNGIIDPVNHLYDDAIFSANTVSVEIEDAVSVINHVAGGGLPAELNWNGKIFLAGHSRGGGIAAIAASLCKSVNKLSLWASISKFDRYGVHQKQIWKDKGFVDVKIRETGQGLTICSSYLEDVEKRGNEISIIDALSGLKIPVQILHGTNDLSVQRREADELAEAVKGLPGCECAFIPAAGHTFGFTSTKMVTDRHIKVCIEKTFSFFGLK